MRYSTHRGPRERPARPPELIRHDGLIKSAPTEPESLLRWSAQRTREEGKLELSRGRGTCGAITACRPHSRRTIALCGVGVEFTTAAIFRGIPDAPVVD